MRHSVFIALLLVSICAQSHNENKNAESTDSPDVDETEEVYYEMAADEKPAGRPFHPLDELFGDAANMEEEDRAPPPDGNFNAINIDGKEFYLDMGAEEGGMNGEAAKGFIEFLKKFNKQFKGKFGGLPRANIQSVSVEPCPGGCDRAGGALLTIVGSGLGLATIELDALESMNSYSCPFVEGRVSDHELVCIVPPARGEDITLDVRIKIKGQQNIVIGKAVKYAPSNTKSKETAPTKNTPDASMEDLKDFEAIGIGGLRAELDELRRRVLVLRQPSKRALLQRLGIRPVRGILLYGPPGTGKTLVARKVAALVMAKHTKVVNGPELVSKYVGDSEALVRGLFAEAMKEYKSMGPEAGLHVIILDELDAMLRPRGSGDESMARATYDSITTQFLALMDGFDSAPNILLIGLTNRISALDPALLRPGRFEVRIRLPIPNLEGRHEILRVHTKTLREGAHLEASLDLLSLSRRMMGFTGADIEGSVRAAIAHAMERSTFLVTDSDFDQAIQEVMADPNRPGNSFCAYFDRGIIAYTPLINEIAETFARNVKRLLESPRGGTLKFLLEGPAGSGLTATAAYLASIVDLPYVRFISAETIVGLRPDQKLQTIITSLEEARDASAGLVIIDTMEQLLEWSAVGQRVNPVLLHELSVLLNAPNVIKGGRVGGTGPGRVILLATTHQKDALELLGLYSVWDTKRTLALLSRSQQIHFLKSLRAFKSDQDVDEAAKELPVPMGPKRLLFLVDASRAAVGLTSPLSIEGDLAAPYHRRASSTSALEEDLPLTREAEGDLLTAAQFHSTLRDFKIMEGGKDL